MPYAEYVNKLINDIPDNLTIYDIANIELAYNTYAKLTYAEKQKIFDKHFLRLAIFDILKKVCFYIL